MSAESQRISSNMRWWNMPADTCMLMCWVHNFQQWAIYTVRRPICQIFTVMFPVQSVHFWAGIINQRQWLKVELSLAEKPHILMAKALTVWQFRSLCSACNTIVLMKDSATVLQAAQRLCVRERGCMLVWLYPPVGLQRMCSLCLCGFQPLQSWLQDGRKS